ncbi:unnamed protein product, partial [marine sediment metagenome]
MHTLTFFFFALSFSEIAELLPALISKYLYPTLVGLLHLGQTSIILDK